MKLYLIAASLALMAAVACTQPGDPSGESRLELVRDRG